jgi:hypothetical protein
MFFRTWGSRTALLILLVPMSLAVGLLTGCGGDAKTGSGETVVTIAAQETTSSLSTTTSAAVETTTSAAETTTSEATTTTTVAATTTTAAPTTTTKSTTTTTWPKYVMSWPSGKSGWTVQVAKYDSGSDPDAPAHAKVKALKLIAKNLPGGVLYSGHFSSIQDGWYVTFSGVFKTKAAAQSFRTKVLNAGFAGAVVIQLVP